MRERPIRQGRWGWVPGRETLKTGLRRARLRAYADPVRRMYERGWLDKGRLRLPEFLGIGAPKAGTTWLHHNLAAHPDLYLPDGKEMHYFSSRQYLGLRWYAGQFTAAGDRTPGEITPGYSALPIRDIKRVHQLIPEARLLLLVRHPIERAWSHAVMKLARETGRDVSEVPDTEYLDHFRSPYSMERGDYLDMIDRWTQVFPADQLWVGSFNCITDKPRQLLIDVFRHLGVRDDVNWEHFPYAQVIDRGVHGTEDVFGRSTRPDVPERFLEALEPLLRPQIERFAERYPEIGTPWLA